MTDPIDNVLAYWFEPRPATSADVEARRRFWFESNEATDLEIRERFGALVEEARAGRLDAWRATARGTLALLVLLDQFSRNLYRGRPDAFSHDPVALEIAEVAFATGLFDELDLSERMFAALPYRHAEDVASQVRAVELAVHDALTAPPIWRDFAIYSVDWARKHLDVIVRFGRFPHRNAILGRPSTAEELEFLKQPGSAF